MTAQLVDLWQARIYADAGIHQSFSEDLTARRSIINSSTTKCQTAYNAMKQLTRVHLVLYLLHSDGAQLTQSADYTRRSS
jgi:hypothetical protein